MPFRPTSLAATAPYVAAVAIAALPLFAHLDALPVRLWDESRLAFNALEMARGESHPLVPTYGGEPEMWNTKPPLFIWIQALFIRVLGEGELALRLPSGLAALATCLLLVRFAQKWLGRPWLGVLAVGVLITARGYVSLHGTRTGDYDALMTLFATGYGLAWFLYTEKRDHRMLWTAAACIAGAVLTKGVGGLLPLPALFLYSVFSGGILRQLRDPQMWLALLAVGAVVAGYYGARETINPGYLAAVRANELGGRYTEVNEAHTAPAHWYVGNLLGYRFRPWVPWWGAGVLLGIFSRDGVLRRTTLFSVLFCGVHLAVISSAATKLEWYDLPVYPLAALTAATGIYILASALRQQLAHLLHSTRFLSILFTTAALITLFFFPYRAALHRALSHELNHWDPPQETFAAEYLQQIQRGERVMRLDALVWKDYYASLAWYRALMHPSDVGVEPTPLDSLRTGQHVYTAQEQIQRDLVAQYAADTIDRYKDVVVVYRITGRR